MKRTIILCFCILFFVTGCNKNENIKDNTETVSSDGIVEFNPYRLRCHGGYLMVNMKSSDAIALAGKERKYVELKSCAFEGMDKIYIYNGYEIYVNMVNDKEVVSRLVLTDDSAMTKEGIYIGDSIQNMIKAYGNDYKEKNGMYVYDNGSSLLNIGTEADVIISIEMVIK